jgi:hypothetical protein
MRSTILTIISGSFMVWYIIKRNMQPTPSRILLTALCHTVWAMQLWVIKSYGAIVFEGLDIRVLKSKFRKCVYLSTFVLHMYNPRNWHCSLKKTLSALSFCIISVSDFKISTK